jgi:hypothetical protein
VVFHEVDRFPGVEQVRGDGVAHEVHVTMGRWEVGERGIAAEESLDLAFLESSLAADEESRVGVGA